EASHQLVLHERVHACEWLIHEEKARPGRERAEKRCFHLTAPRKGTDLSLRVEIEAIAQLIGERAVPGRIQGREVRLELLEAHPAREGLAFGDVRDLRSVFHRESSTVDAEHRGASRACAAE